MKKQILILVLTVLGLFANLASALAQNCTDGPLAPVAGHAYSYSATIAGAGYDGTGTYTWYVTSKPDLFDATGKIANNAGEIIATGGGAYNSGISGAAAKDLTIKWTSQAILNGLTSPYYLVVQYSQNNGTCTAMNLKVWQIQPINKFLLAINTFSGTIGQDGVYCAADVTSAIVTPGTTPTVAYIYGVNTLYAEITASNYDGDWTPAFNIQNLNGAQTIASVSWATDQAFTTPHTTNVVGNVATSTDKTTAAYDGSNKIYVKMVINNNSFENLAGQTNLTIGVDGTITAGSSTLNDVVSATDCSDEAAFGKTVVETIKNRPTISDTATPSFITKNP